MAAAPTEKVGVYIKEAKEEQLGSFGLGEAGKDLLKYKLTTHTVHRVSVKGTSGKVTLNKDVNHQNFERTDNYVIVLNISIHVRRGSRKASHHTEFGQCGQKTPGLIAKSGQLQSHLHMLQGNLGHLLLNCKAASFSNTNFYG